MTADEEFVRANCNDPLYTTHTYGRSACAIVTADNVRVGYGINEQSAWSAAAEFTRERIEQIRQVERQIEWCQAGLSEWYDPIYWHWDENEREEESVMKTRAQSAREDVTGRLIVARLEAIRDDLKRGMK